MARFDYQSLCGWVYDPLEIARIVATLPMPVFSSAAPHLKDTGEGKDVWFWAFEEKALGRVLNSYNQGIGDCVGNGWARGVQDLMLAEMASGEAEEIPPDVLSALDDGTSGFVSCEVIYGGSRCEIGGWWGQTSDGSLGSYAAKWVNEYGVALRRKYEAGGDVIDLTAYSAQRAKSYGAKGCPDALEPEVREHPVQTVSQVRTYEEVRDALVNLYPVPVASDQGFTMKRRAGGWCDAKGTWMHQMTYRAHLITKGNKPAVVCQNSWGDYLGQTNNRVTLESGKEITLPMGCFLVQPETVTRMARQGDTFAASGFRGFPRRLDVVPWIFA